MISQKSNGSHLNTVMVSGSVADLTTLCGILEGECTIYDEKSSGGTVANVPEFNMMKFSVGKKYIGGKRRSQLVSLKHIKTTKTLNDVRAAVNGVWDADFVTTDKCEYVNGVGTNSRG